MARKPELRLRGAEDLRKQLNANQKREIRQFYIDVYNDNKAEIDKLKNLPQNTSTRLQTMRLKQLEGHLQEAYNGLYSELENKVVKDMTTVSNAVMSDTAAFWKSVELQLNNKISIDYANFSTSIVEDLYFGRVYSGNWTLSKSIWGDYTGVSDDISRIIAKGVAEGKGTYDIAKALETYVNPNAQKPISWSRFYPHSKNQIDYNAVRLARTEISHAYQLATIRTAATNPFASGIKWHAANHANTCPLCQDIDGKVFPIDECPLDHPNGFCTFTIVLEKSLEDIANELVEWANGAENERLDEFYEKKYTIDPNKPVGISLKTAAAAAIGKGKKVIDTLTPAVVANAPKTTVTSVSEGRAIEVIAPNEDNGGSGEVYRDLDLTNKRKPKKKKK